MTKFKAGSDLTVTEYMYLENNVLNVGDPLQAYLQYLKAKQGPCKNNYFATKACNTPLPSFNGMHRHHDMENRVANLSDPAVARVNLWEYQEARNLTYCRPAEHTLLHILIAEQGVLGVHGAMTLLDTCSIEPKLRRILEDRLNASATVFTWNRTVVIDAVAMLNTYRLCYMQIATGVGKSTSALEVAKAVNRDFLVISNSNKINTDWTTRNCLNPRFKGAITPTKFKNIRDSLDLSNILIIVDEAHHLIEKGKWGPMLTETFKANPEMMLLGLSASEFRAKNRKTATGDMEPVWYRVFEGHAARGIRDLAEGIERGVLAPITYICACYDKSSLANAISLSSGWRDTAKRVALKNKLDLLKNEMAIANLLNTYQPETMIRDLVFIENIGETEYVDPATGMVRRINDEEHAKAVIKAARPELTDDNFRIVHSKQSEKVNAENFEWFETEAEDARYLISIGMVKEGYHPEILTGGIIFRRIKAGTVFEQILGRFAMLKKKAKHKITVFDFVDAVRSSQFKFESGTAGTTKKSVRPDVIQKLSELKACGVKVIDYTEKLDELVAEITTETCAPVFTAEELL